MLDELACLARDLLVMKTARKEAITMLSGIATDEEAIQLTAQLTTAELIRIMERLQKTLAGFTRSASRRMDAELCLVELCQPELELDAESLNVRLTRLEEQIKTGSFVMQKPSEAQETPLEEERPPMPEDPDAPPLPQEEQAQPEIPSGFWVELVAGVRKELKPPASGFFVATPNAPVRGVLVGDRLELRCEAAFIAQMLDKPDILEIVSRKAGAMLNRPIRAVVVDLQSQPKGAPKMEQLLNFGRSHGDIVTIKE